MNRRMTTTLAAGLAFTTFAGLAWPQQASTESATTSAPTATRPLFTDIDAALAQDLKDITVERQPLEKIFEFLADLSHANIVVNWPALEAAGVKRDTPVTLQLRNIAFEQAIRAVCEVIPSKDTRLNYVVGEGAVEITTNAQLASGHEMRLFDLTKVLQLQLMPTPPAPPTDPLPTTTAKAPADPLRTARAEKILAIIRAEITRIGDHPDGKDRELYIKNDTLLATQSRRAQVTILRIVQSFAAPLKPGSVPAGGGGVASVRQKKAEEQMLKLLKDQGTNPASLQTIAEDHAKLAPDLNLIVLPGVLIHADVDPPQKLDYLVNDAGIVMIAPADAIRARTLLAVYDLRDLIKRLSLKPENKSATAAELSARIVATLKKKVTPDLWSDLGQGSCSLTEYEGLLVVIAPPPVYRALGAAWKEAEK